MPTPLIAIKSDLAFRAVFGRECDQCKKALTALLNDILDLHIISLAYVNPLNLQTYQQDKKTEMDIEVITDQGHRIDIEIQLISLPGFQNRMVYYAGQLLDQALQTGEDYTILNTKKCKVLSIADFILFPHTPQIKNTYRFQEITTHHQLTDIIEIIFLEMPKLDPHKPIPHMTTIEQWLYFLRYADDPTKQPQLQQITNQKEGIQTAMNILQQISADDTLRAQIRFREKAQRDQLARENAARQEGRLAERIQIATNLLDILDDRSIAQKTGLTIQEVAAIRQTTPCPQQ